MNRLNKKEVIQALSVPRIQPYMGTTTDVSEALKNYENNLRLSTAIYPVLQQFEIVYRNRLEAMLISHHGTAWFNNPQLIVLLDNYGQSKLQETKTVLNRHQKPMTSGAIVSEMTFGFWTALLGRRYDQTLWNPSSQIIFPFATRSQRDIRIIRPQLIEIRDLRNRIAHYEGIWKDTQLLQKYQSIKQLLTWMNPHAALWLERCRLDQFSKVHKSIFNP